MAAVTICSDFGAQKNKVSHCFIKSVTSLYFKWHFIIDSGQKITKESILYVSSWKSIYMNIFINFSMKYNNNKKMKSHKI